MLHMVYGEAAAGDVLTWPDAMMARTQPPAGWGGPRDLDPVAASERALRGSKLHFIFYVVIHGLTSRSACRCYFVVRCSSLRNASCILFFM
jgi:hypothetical protein